MRISIANLKEKEITQFYRLFRKLLKNDFPEYSRQVREVQLNRDFSKKSFLKMIGKKGATVVVAKFKGEIIGFIVLEKYQGGVVDINWLGVKRGFRGEGIGSRLLAAAEKWALERKCHCLMVETENKRNVAFYLKRGFDYVGVQKESWYGVNEYLLQKNLCKPFRSIFKV